MAETTDKSRRNFLKKLFYGSILGIAAMLPTASGALKITKNGIFSDNESASTGGAKLVLQKVGSGFDPTTAEVGQMWYREDLD